MVVQLTPVTPPGRRIRVNTVAFDVECVLLLTHNIAQTETVNGVVFRKADIAKYFVPHQNLTTIAGDAMMGYLSVVPYGASFDITHDTEIDPNLSPHIDNDPLVSPNDEVGAQIIHYKHHTRCLHLSETCFTTPVGTNITAIAPLIFFTAPTHTSYAWSWFNLTATTEELIIIPCPDILTAYPEDYLNTLELKANLGHVVPDCAVRNCIYSTYQVIRGNEYGTRESIIDYPTPA